MLFSGTGLYHQECCFETLWGKTPVYEWTNKSQAQTVVGKCSDGTDYMVTYFEDVRYLFSETCAPVAIPFLNFRLCWAVPTKQRGCVYACKCRFFGKRTTQPSHFTETDAV